MNLYEQQAANRRRTWLIMLAFVAFLVFLGFGFDAFYIGLTGGYVPVGSVMALGVGSVSALTSYFHGDRAVLLASGAQPLSEVAASATDADKLKLRQLDNVVDEMAIAAGLPRPRVYVVPDPDPNAFATGRDPAHASLAVTRGLIDALDREELLVAGARRGRFWGGAPRRRDDDRRDGGGLAGIVLFVLWLIAVMLAPL